jgi:hypothetical protein
MTDLNWISPFQVVPLEEIIMELGRRLHLPGAAASKRELDMDKACRNLPCVTMGRVEGNQ